MSNFGHKKAVAARLLATTSMTKTAVAESVGIGRRTLFNWLDDPEFRQKIDDIRDKALEKPDVKTFLGMLSEGEKKEVLRLLTTEQHKAFLPEIRIIESRVMEELNHDEQQDAIKQIERLLGRFRRNILREDGYEPDGSADISSDAMGKLKAKVDREESFLNQYLQMKENERQYERDAEAGLTPRP